MKRTFRYHPLFADEIGIVAVCLHHTYRLMDDPLRPVLSTGQYLGRTADGGQLYMNIDITVLRSQELKERKMRAASALHDLSLATGQTLRPTVVEIVARLHQINLKGFEQLRRRLHRLEAWERRLRTACRRIIRRRMKRTRFA